MLTIEEQIKLIADAAIDALDLDTAADRRATPRETVLDLPVTDTSSPVQFTEEAVTMIDVRTTDPTEPRQKRPTLVVVAGILAAAAVFAVAFVVIRDANDVTPANELPNTPDGALLEPGTYFVDEVDGTPTVRISFSLDVGWSSATSIDENGHETGTSLWQGGIGYINFSRADKVEVYSDACHWSDGFYPGPVANLADFISALSEQGGWAEVTGPSDISVGGYAGKAFQRTAPDDPSGCSTIPSGWSPHIRPANWLSGLPGLRSWRYGTEEFGWSPGDAYEPGEVETLWVLDLDGTVVVINARLWPSATQEWVALSGPGVAARAQFAAVLDSIRIDRV